MGLRYISQVIAVRMGDYYDLRNGMAYISAQGVVEHHGNVDELDALIDQNIER